MTKCKKCHRIKVWKDGSIRFYNYKVIKVNINWVYNKSGKIIKL